MNVSRTGLRVAMVLFGLAVIFTGLNRAYGGIATLGWQGRRTSPTVANQQVWLIQDNHTRFLGGVWTAVGLSDAGRAGQPAGNGACALLRVRRHLHRRPRALQQRSRSA